MFHWCQSMDEQQLGSVRWFGAVVNWMHALQSYTSRLPQTRAPRQPKFSMYASACPYVLLFTALPHLHMEADSSRDATLQTTSSGCYDDRTVGLNGDTAAGHKVGLICQACPLIPFAKASVPNSSLVFSQITSHACRMCLACQTRAALHSAQGDQRNEGYHGVQLLGVSGLACRVQGIAEPSSA